MQAQLLECVFQAIGDFSDDDALHLAIRPIFNSFTTTTSSSLSTADEGEKGEKVEKSAVGVRGKAKSNPPPLKKMSSDANPLTALNSKITELIKRMKE